MKLYNPQEPDAIFPEMEQIFAHTKSYMEQHFEVDFQMNECNKHPDDEPEQQLNHEEVDPTVQQMLTQLCDCLSRAEFSVVVHECADILIAVFIRDAKRSFEQETTYTMKAKIQMHKNKLLESSDTIQQQIVIETPANKMRNVYVGRKQAIQEMQSILIESIEMELERMFYMFSISMNTYFVHMQRNEKLNLFCLLV